MKKILIVATVWGFFDFLKNDIKLLQANGFEVHCATNFRNVNKPMQITNIVKHQVDFARSPLSKSNLKAIRQLSHVMKETSFDIVHCHTPVGGVVARLVAGKYRKTGTKIFYTAHGFHFYKGAPLINWLVYFPVEWLCSWKTDLQITINREDYGRAKKTLHAGKTVYLPGVGIDLQEFNRNTAITRQKKKELGVSDDETMILSVGELSKRKNHEIIIRALQNCDNRKIRYFIAGKGELKPYLQKLIKDMNLSGNVQLLGYRTDISELCKAADFFVMPSHQEGLPVALMEAMASGLPCICKNIRGNKDLIVPGKGGYLVDGKNVRSWTAAIEKMMISDRKTMGTFNRNRVRNFSIDNVQRKMEKIYFGK